MFLLLDTGDTVAARCSLWWRDTPSHEGQRVGLIGHYADREFAAAAELLKLASARLAEHGCRWAVGPMDGNTWQNYRLVVETGTELPFFLEPTNPADWPEHFRANGFAEVARYYSALNTDLAQPDPGLAGVAREIDAQGIHLRPLDLARLDAELGCLHELSTQCFRDSFLFTPIMREDFIAQYRELADFVRPDLILLAEQGERLIGYIFALPDWLQARRGATIDTFIIKTLAVHSDFHGIGVGRLLAARCHEIARATGYRRAIHALMLDTSGARKLSDPIAKPFRRYALFGRPLTTDAL